MDASSLGGHRVGEEAAKTRRRGRGQRRSGDDASVAKMTRIVVCRRTCPLHDCPMAQGLGNAASATQVSSTRLNARRPRRGKRNGGKERKTASCSYRMRLRRSESEGQEAGEGRRRGGQEARRAGGEEGRRQASKRRRGQEARAGGEEGKR